MKQYRVCEDLQGGDFGKGRVYTASEWLDQAVEWRDSDGSWGEYGEGTDCYGTKHLDSRSWFIKFWRRIIKDGREQELIDYIADIWSLEFEEITEEQKTLYNDYVEQYHKHSYGEPVCFEEWLDNEWEEIKSKRGQC